MGTIDYEALIEKHRGKGDEIEQRKRANKLAEEKDEQAPAAVNEEKPAPAPPAELEEEWPERDLLGTGAVGAVIGGFIGGAGGAAFGGMLGLTGATLREDHKKKRKGWY